MNTISKPAKVWLNALNLEYVSGTIRLPGSKSISNRALIIRALCHENFEISNLSDSDDTRILNALLHSGEEVLDAHHAGTTFRFLTAYLALTGRNTILTGSERMKQRPIGPLVDALRSLGASIDYMENDGFPPIKINRPTSQPPSVVRLNAGISSQYISALLMVAPTLPDGLEILLEGDAVSWPYIEMTLQMMEYFGIKTDRKDNSIRVQHQHYQARDFFVESDWSAASYFYIIAGLSKSATITLEGLNEHSLQGDAAIARLSEKFGIETEYIDHKIVIRKVSGVRDTSFFENDFIQQPDIAQSISVLAAGHGTHTVYSGLQTLKIKETDRIAALQRELAKFGVYLSPVPERLSGKSGKSYYLQEGKAMSPDNDECIATYNDHRMAMAFAPLALKFPVCIADPEVVSKSYPGFWDDLKKLGFIIKFS
jgi:3-phosphoshikimate 1-carboxyvinyltransferase